MTRNWLFFYPQLPGQHRRSCNHAHKRRSRCSLRDDFTRITSCSIAFLQGMRRDEGRDIRTASRLVQRSGMRP